MSLVEKPIIALAKAENAMRENSKISRVGKDGALMMQDSVTYITREIIDAALDQLEGGKTKTISPEIIKNAIEATPELQEMFPHLVIPHTTVPKAMSDHREERFERLKKERKASPKKKSSSKKSSSKKSAPKKSKKRKVPEASQQDASDDASEDQSSSDNESKRMKQ